MDISFSTNEECFEREVLKHSQNSPSSSALSIFCSYILCSIQNLLSATSNLSALSNSPLISYLIKIIKKTEDFHDSDLA